MFGVAAHEPFDEVLDRLAVLIFGREGDADERAGRRITLPIVYQLPPAALIAASNAFLLSVRRSPELRGMSISPSAARRSASSRAKSSSLIALRGGGEDLDAMVASRFCANSPVHVGHVQLFMKIEDHFGLYKHFRGGA